MFCDHPHVLHQRGQEHLLFLLGVRVRAKDGEARTWLEACGGRCQQPEEVDVSKLVTSRKKEKLQICNKGQELL